MLTRENGNVHITIAEDDFMLLLLALGFAIGAVREGDGTLFRTFIRLADTINEGNSNYKPYGTTPAGTVGTEK